MTPRIGLVSPCWMDTRGIGDQRPVTAPAFHLGLVDDNMSPVAIKRSGPW